MNYLLSYELVYKFKNPISVYIYLSVFTHTRMHAHRDLSLVCALNEQVFL